MSTSCFCFTSVGILCCRPFVDCLIETTAAKFLSDANLNPETKQILSQLECAITMVLSIVGPNTIIKKSQDYPTDSDIRTDDVDLGWTKTGSAFGDWKASPKSVGQIRRRISKHFTLVILNEDDLFTKYTFQERITQGLLRSRFLFPLKDSDVMLKDDVLADKLMQDLNYEQGKALPFTYNTDFNMQTDESFSRMFFYGIGVVLLVNHEKMYESDLGPFVVDMPLQKLAVRKLYRKYGARVHFSRDQKVTAIYDYATKKLVKPGDKNGWYAAKMLAKVTATMLVTAREHLTWTHLLCSNAATRESTLKLAPSHPIRRLLTIFTFRATEVNTGAFDTLVPKTSLLHRTTAFTYSALKKVFDMSYRECNIFQPFSERTYSQALTELAEEGKLPYITQGNEYFELVRNFVRAWLDKAGYNDDVGINKDAQVLAFYQGMRESTKGQKYELPNLTNYNMVNLLSSIIFAATAYHELVGSTVDYALLPSRTGLRLTKHNPEKTDFQSYLITQFISASTSLKMPQLISPFPNFFGAKGAPSWERAVWNDFQVNLKQQSAKVQAEDAERIFRLSNNATKDPMPEDAVEQGTVDVSWDFEFKFFDPARFECSVSL